MATITNRTKIPEIIKINPDRINAIASLAKPLEKLKNSLLRRIMAPGVTLEAAAIGDCDLEHDSGRCLPGLGSVSLGKM